MPMVVFQKGRVCACANPKYPVFHVKEFRDFKVTHLLSVATVSVFLEHRPFFLSQNYLWPAQFRSWRRSWSHGCWLQSSRNEIMPYGQVGITPLHSPLQRVPPFTYFVCYIAFVETEVEKNPRWNLFREMGQRKRKRTFSTTLHGNADMVL